MTHSKAIDGLGIRDGTRSEPTPRTFARAAGLANLLVATLVFVEFSGMALVEHDSWPFEIGLWLVPLVTLVIWASAVVLYFLALGPKAIRVLGRHLVGRPPSSPSAKSGVWDDWLDRPDRHDR
jgi:hypothetical protein